MAFALPVQADTLTFGLNYEFSDDGNEPEGSSPWLTATFEDIAASGEVKLTLDASGLSNDEYVAGVAGPSENKKGWYFNFDPSKNLDLNFTLTSGNGADSILQNANEFKADGDGYFDILFTWDKTLDSLTSGEKAVYTITSASSSNLAASWFNFLSVDSDTGYHTAAHVQGIYDPLGLPNNTDGSGWIGDSGGGGGGGDPVPVPATILLLGSGLAGIVASQRKKFKKRNR